MAVSALVLGIVGLILSLNPFTSLTGLICGILAVIFGAVGVSKKDNDRGKGIAGIVLGVITLIICVILVILVLNCYEYIRANLPKFLEELGETIENSLESFENYVEEYTNEMTDSILDEVERSQRNALRNIF